MRRIALLGVVLLLASACELQEVVVADPEPFVVVEAYLIANHNPQLVAIHASAGASTILDEDASVVLTSGADSFHFGRTDPEACLAADVAITPIDFPGGLACYAAAPPLIVPGGFYRLQVVLPDGRWLLGATRVPHEVGFIEGTADEFPCYFEPWTQRAVTWRRVEGVAAYIMDLRALGVRDALAREGIDAEVPEPLILRGLAIGTEDTTIVLPREFGLFDRFVLDPALLVALQQGVPPEVDFDVTLAAVDQNYVNWVRGGDFNPSGLIRMPSMRGTGGTGVLGSFTETRFVGSSRDTYADNARCAQPLDE